MKNYVLYTVYIYSYIHVFIYIEALKIFCEKITGVYIILQVTVSSLWQHTVPNNFIVPR